MRPGSRLALVCVVFGALALSLFLLYGRRSTAERPPDTPLAAVRELVGSDNTAVGRLGGLRSVALVAERRAPEGGRALAAAVTGGRERAMLYADLIRRDGRWNVVRAALDLASGDRLPLRGPTPSLAPVSHRTVPPPPEGENR